MEDYSQKNTVKKFTRYRSPSTFRVRKNLSNIKNKIVDKLSKGGKQYEP